VIHDLAIILYVVHMNELININRIIIKLKMSFRGPVGERPDNTEKPKTFIRDSEHSMTYSP
jgi:hypothetical protein